MINNNIEAGYLELFIGPMWSGKTSELIKIHKIYSFSNTQIFQLEIRIKLLSTMN